MTSTLLTVTTERHDSRTVVRVVGEVDMATAPLLADRLDRVVAEGVAGTVVIDLTAVGFLASAGLAALMRANGRIEESDAELVVVATPGTAPSRAITITSLDQVFRLVGDLDEATASSS